MTDDSNSGIGPGRGGRGDAPQGGVRRLRGGRQWTVHIVSAADIAPRLRRVRLGGESLAEFSHWPGQEIILYIPQAAGEAARRHYTIRAFDAAARLLDVDFVLHGDSPAVRWARSARPGDALEIGGPRGRITAVEHADWHLLSGDETALPAIFAIVEALPADAVVRVFLEVTGPADRLLLRGPAQLQLSWLYRGAESPGRGTLLADAVAAFELPRGRGHAYLLGETGSVKAQRQSLRERGLLPEQISAEGYWRHGRIGGHDHILEPGQERPRF